MTLSREEVTSIRAVANEVRRDVVRMVNAAACGHPSRVAAITSSRWSACQECAGMPNTSAQRARQVSDSNLTMRASR